MSDDALKRIAFPLLVVFVVSSTLVGRANADVIFPLSFPFLPYIPAIILLEVLVFLAVRGRLGIKITAGKGIVIVTLANILSSAVGLVVPGPYKGSLFLWTISAFILSTFVEGIFYGLLMKEIRKGLLMSLILNTASYIMAVTVMDLK